MIGALELYSSGLAARGAEGLRSRVRGEQTVRLPLERWLNTASAVDESALRRARGPVIDLGCGPGRHLHALARQGIFALGVDISPVAVTLARTRGGQAIEASVFDELPGSGRWRTALLLDGNIGIGGRPDALLRRTRHLLSDDGQVLIELDGPEVRSATVQARIESRRLSSAWFPWARVGADDTHRLAALSGLRVSEEWSLDGRWFALCTVADAEDDSGVTPRL